MKTHQRLSNKTVQALEEIKTSLHLGTIDDAVQWYITHCEEKNAVVMRRFKELEDAIQALYPNNTESWEVFTVHNFRQIYLNIKGNEAEAEKLSIYLQEYFEKRSEEKLRGQQDGNRTATGEQVD